MTGNCSYSHTLTFFLRHSQTIYSCLQAAILIFFVLKVATLNKYTYKGTSNKSLFFHEAFCKVRTHFTPVIS